MFALPSRIGPRSNYRFTATRADFSPRRCSLLFVAGPRDFKIDGPGLGKGGTGTLIVDGKEVETKHMEHSVPFTFRFDETFDVGLDTGTPVAQLEYHYDVPFRFTGRLDKLTFNLQPPQMTAEEQRQFQALSQRNNHASE